MIADAVAMATRLPTPQSPPESPPSEPPHSSRNFNARGHHDGATVRYEHTAGGVGGDAVRLASG